MATVSIVLASCDTKSLTGHAMQVALSQPIAAQNITSSGTSQKFNASTASAKQTSVWVVTVTGGNVWIKAGTDPTAAAGDDWLVLDGTTRDFGVSADGEVLAVVDA